MKRNGSCNLEPVAPGHILGKAMAIKLPPDLLDKIQSSSSDLSRITIKFSPTENMLIFDSEEFTLTEVKEDATVCHDVYHQRDEDMHRVAQVHSRLNVQRILNQQVTAKVREQTQQLEYESRGKKIGSVEEAAPTPTAKRKGQTVKNHIGLPAKRGGTKVETKHPLIATPKDALKRRLIHALAASKDGMRAAALESELGLSLKDLKFTLTIISTQEKPDVYKLAGKHYDSVNVDYEGYTHEQKAIARANKHKYLLEKAANPTVGKTHANGDFKRKRGAPTNFKIEDETAKRREEGKGKRGAKFGISDELRIEKPRAPPAELANGLHSKNHKPLPPIKNFQEYETYRKEFEKKHERFQELDTQLKANSDEFTELAKQFSSCTEQEAKKTIGESIRQKFAQRRNSVKDMVREYKTLASELADLKTKVNIYKATPNR